MASSVKWVVTVSLCPVLGTRAGRICMPSTPCQCGVNVANVWSGAQEAPSARTVVLGLAQL